MARPGRKTKTSGQGVVRLHCGSFEVAGMGQTSPTFKTRAEAQRWMDALLAKLPARQRPQERACICCGQEFWSEGVHNRMCQPCRIGARDMTGSHSYARPTRNGLRIGAL